MLTESQLIEKIVIEAKPTEEVIIATPVVAFGNSSVFSFMQKSSIVEELTQVSEEVFEKKALHEESKD